jgi:ketosteroid isomerase-like protein
MSMTDWRRKQGDHDARIDTVEQHGARIVVTFSWADKQGRRHDWAHVLKLKDGKIVDMQDYASPTRAAATTRLRAVFQH